MGGREGEKGKDESREDKENDLQDSGNSRLFEEVGFIGDPEWIFHVQNLDFLTNSNCKILSPSQVEKLREAAKNAISYCRISLCLRALESKLLEKCAKMLKGSKDMENKKKVFKDSESLTKANCFLEKRLKKKETTGRRPLFHFTPPIGWLNDPNGFSYHDGKIHLFYQHNPYGIDWDTMHWGHATSKDFIHWNNERIALAPDMPYDNGNRGGCFSGSAFEHAGEYWLMYTGVGMKDGRLIQAQCAARSLDGVRFEKVKENPLIGEGKGLPDSMRAEEFRDPKVWEHNGALYMIAAAQNKKDDYANLLIYKSFDALNWKFLGIAYSNSEASENLTGHMLECPDLFPLNGKDVIITCPIAMKGNRNENGCISLIGQFDYESGKFEMPEGREAEEVDLGFDFYAPQTMVHPDGRRIIIGWMQCPSRPSIGSLLGFEYANAMTFPRELTVIDDKLHQWPVSEIEKCRRGKRKLEKVLNDEKTVVPEFEGTAIDLELSFEPISGTGLTAFADSNGRGLNIVYENGKLIIDRSDLYPNEQPETAKITAMPAPIIDGKVKIRLLLDKISAEVFVADGRYVATMVVMANEDNRRVFLCAETQNKIVATKYEIAL